MKEELEIELQKSSPIFLAELYGDVDKTAMHCGFACGDGWFEPLKKFCIKTQELNECLKGAAIVAKQIEEKFGELRVCWALESTDKPVFARDSGDREDYSEVIEQFREYKRALCDETKMTCELCGNKQRPLVCTKGLIKYVCDSCYNARD